MTHGLQCQFVTELPQNILYFSLVRFFLLCLFTVLLFSASVVNKDEYIKQTRRCHRTLRPSTWLMAADSLRVHSSTTLARISFMNSMNALSGFLMCSGFFLASRIDDGGTAARRDNDRSLTAALTAISGERSARQVRAAGCDAPPSGDDSTDDSWSWTDS